MVKMVNENVKNAAIFNCEICKFKCCKLSDYNRHILRAKHIKNEKMVKNDKNGNIKTPKNAKSYKCECGKEYSHLSGLSRHKKTCDKNSEIKGDEYTDEKNILSDKELILTLLKQNAELL